LEWARTALANFEAAALMHPWLAPRNASELFWHADNNWANPLWWLRFLRNCVYGAFYLRKAPNHDSVYNAEPKLLWMLLSLVSLVMFGAVPLSGLTMELSPILRSTTRKASILGPGPDSYHQSGQAGLPQIVEGTWRLGGNATPPDASYFFAADGTSNVSLTYFEDMARLRPNSSIATFLGPAVNEEVSGSAYGTATECYCRQVAASELKLVGGTEDPTTNYTVMFTPPNDYPRGSSTSGKPGTGEADFAMAWLPEKDMLGPIRHPPYNMILAADGTYYGNGYGASTLEDSIRGPETSSPTTNAPPTAYLEIFLWQGDYLYQDSGTTPPTNFTVDDPILRGLLDSESPRLQKGSSGGTPYVGFAVQCEVRSQLGYASINPATRTFTNFTGVPALSMGGDNDVFYPNMQAVMAVGDWDDSAYKLRVAHAMESRFHSLAQAIGLPARKTILNDVDVGRYPALTPENVVYSLYRLLGQTVIVPMGARSQEPWEGDLYVLETVRWLRPGPVPWQVVLALLATWTILTVSLSIWTLFTKRWAPTLGGFEFFRLGADYTNEVHRFNSRRFEGSATALGGIPGMIGVMPGGMAGAQEGFIGLSENAAERDRRYAFDRGQAGMHRSP
jgi:hypothetical protein